MTLATLLAFVLFFLSINFIFWSIIKLWVAITREMWLHYDWKYHSNFLVFNEFYVELCEVTLNGIIFFYCLMRIIRHIKCSNFVWSIMWNQSFMILKLNELKLWKTNRYKSKQFKLNQSSACQQQLGAFFFIIVFFFLFSEWHRNK